MSYARRFAVTVTTDASGDADVDSPDLYGGELVDIHYIPDATTPLAGTANLTVTVTNADGFSRPVVTKSAIGTSAFTLAPRQPVHAVADGSAITGAQDRIALGEVDKLNFVIDTGGNATTGVFYVTIA